MTKEEVLRKKQEQTERCGIKPVTAMSAMRSAPSIASEDIFWAPPTDRSNKHKHLQNPYISPYPALKPRIADNIDPDETEEYDSDQTVADYNYSDSENDSNMPSPKKQKTKQVQYQYNGPQPWMLDESRTDPVAMAVKNNRSRNLNDLMSGTTQVDPIHSSQTSEPSIADPPTPIPRSAKPRTKLSDGVNDPANVHLKGGLPDFYDRLSDFERFKEERRIRDEDEMYEGLRNFQGRQRGWNGEHESDRSVTLNEYNLEQKRKFLEKYHKAKADTNYKSTSTPKGKDQATPHKQPYPEPDYTGMSKEEMIQAMGKHLKDGYTLLIKQARNSELEFDAIVEENTWAMKAKMMARPWALDAIKAEALAEQRARMARGSKPSLTVKLKINLSVKVSDSKKRSREDDDAAGGVKWVRVR
jgi:hypothetical protein